MLEYCNKIEWIMAFNFGTNTEVLPHYQFIQDVVHSSLSFAG
jgi:hypothetical protein